MITEPLTAAFMSQVMIQLLVNMGSVLVWGFVATLVMSLVMSIAQELRLTRMSLPYLVGTLFTPDRQRAVRLGFVVHLLNGWVLALFYAVLFQQIGAATWWIGVIMGAFHALVVLVLLMPLLPGMHPRMADPRHGPSPTRQLQPPGFMGSNYGWRTPLVTIVAHGIYGTILGVTYPIL